MLLILTKPFIPNVDGNKYPKYSQNLGIAAPGQEIPEIKRSGIEVNTKISIQVSRLRIAIDAVMAKNIQAAK